MRLQNGSIRKRRAALGLAVAGAIALAGRGGGQAQSQGLPPAASLSGSWQTYANGDDVLSLAAGAGTVWAGTRAGGLVRWDPATGTYTQFLAPQTPLGGNTVQAVAVDGTGSLWAATNGGLSVLRDGGTSDPADDTWRNYTRASTYGGLPSDDVRSLVIDGTTVWVGGVQEWDGTTKEWRGGGLGRLETQGTDRTDDDTWMNLATFDSTFRRAPDGTETLGLVSNNVLDVQLVDGGLWVATGAHWALEHTADPTAPREWQQVHGGMSHLAHGGTFVSSDDAWTAYSCEDPLQDSDGRPVVACTMPDLDLDPTGRIWAAAGGMGVITFPGSRAILTPGVVFRFQGADGLGGNFVQSIDAGSAPDSVWFTTRDAGVRHLVHGPALRDKRDDVWRSWDVEEGLPRRRAQTVLIDGGRVWVGTGPSAGIGGGVATFLTTDDAVERTLLTAAPIGRAPASNFVTSLAFGEEGTSWDGIVFAGTGSRIQRTFGAGLMAVDTRSTSSVADDTWALYTATATDDDGSAPFSGLAGDNIHAMTVKDHLLWVGSAPVTWDGAGRRYLDGGLAVWDGSSWTSRTSRSTNGGLVEDGVTTLETGCDGELWIGTGAEWTEGRGVSVLTTTAPHNPTLDTWGAYEFPDVASNEVADVASACGAGLMWVGSWHHTINGGWADGGLSRLDRPTGIWTRYDETNGLDTYSAGRIKGEAASVAVASDGDVWVGSFGTKAMTEGALIGTAPYWPAVVNRLRGGVWSTTAFPALGWIGSLAIDGDGMLWGGATRGGTARDSTDPDNWRDDRYLPGLVLWDAATGWRSLGARTAGVPANDIAQVAAAPDGSVWVATEGWGLARYGPNDAPPTPTPTNDAPSPTPSTTPTPTATTRGGSPTSTATGTRATPTPTATAGTPVVRAYYGYLPVCFQR